ncbi:hypothetical protein SAMN05216223_10968 [Actinacidiphila yanglinensis]|uniref:Lipoprotein n=2 Tax=Actinacidiphila yanglinensis TaxID=310779 RepID=A0A1H6CJG7_9ACTN|nr:hypothetical protein SAMN05216223_10968 [Actinacidiphila yanglinensis]
MIRRMPLLALALVPLLGVTACSDGDSGPSGDPQSIRTSLAKTYWKVNGAIPSGIDMDIGRGKFIKCSADKPKLAVYQVENELNAKDGSMTAAQFLSTFRTVLAPQGWKFTLDKVQPSPTETATMSKTTGYVANKDGMQLQLLIQERTSDVPAGGFMDLYSSCVHLGKDQKDILAKYAPGASVDIFQPTSANPHPVPTGPTMAP